MANLELVRRFFFGFLLIWAWGCRGLQAEAPSDYFVPPEAMYSFADFWVVRPLDLAVLPLTATTWVASLPVTAASGTSDQAYDLLIRQLTQHMMKRPLGQFWDWENRDQSRPVVIKFTDGYSMAELSPEQERKYRRALQEHEERILAIERAEEVPQKDRDALARGEERRWENVVRLLLSL
ncbi:MAG: hypothetical protein O2830_02420 [Verrucomicrobia bacterium]|nr:hypothetical protein [Verrucomicrobiota bacterium]